jgi:putative hydrolase of the HAD superfamily
MRPSVKRLRAVVFDLDDTLYPEREYVLSGFREVAAWSELNLGLAAESSYKELEGLFRSGLRGNIFDVWLASYKLAEASLISTLVRVYREHEPAIGPFPEIPSILQRLKGEYRLGLLSDGWLGVQQRKLAALKLSHYFDCIVFSDEWGREAWKPNVRCFNVLLERLAISAAEVVYVGDNPTKDFLGARKAGLDSIWIRQPGLTYTHLEPATPDHRPNISIASILELDSALHELVEGRTDQQLLVQND